MPGSGNATFGRYQNPVLNVKPFEDCTRVLHIFHIVGMVGKRFLLVSDFSTSPVTVDCTRPVTPERTDWDIVVCIELSIGQWR